MEKNYEELIAQFMEVSGSTKHVAQFYLSSSNWSVEVRMNINYKYKRKFKNTFCHSTL